jgi:hypothetical protein
MERELPAGLSDAQRTALCEFFAGHISAGQLTQRLGIEARPPGHASSSERQPPLGLPDGQAASTANAPRSPLNLRRAVQGLLGLRPGRGQIRPDLRRPSA